ncbi:MAG: hypothetical protein LAO24_18845 [Acidobacteriia bacterium]|nr:hypothetical protein [Terriglobia bacterium]
MAMGIFDSHELSLRQTPVVPTPGYGHDTDRWSPNSFAREQIRGLVRQVFFSNIARPIRQVVFTSVDAQTDVGNICRQVGEALASETQASIAVVCRDPAGLEEAETAAEGHTPRIVERANTRLQLTATRVKGNLWFVPDAGYFNAGDVVPVGLACPRLAYSRLAELRREFEYSIVQCLPAGESSEAAALGQLADGIILVLAADRTRRATARKITETLRAAQVQFLGIVLSDRTFPIPESIYRRL